MRSGLEGEFILAGRCAASRCPSAGPAKRDKRDIVVLAMPGGMLLDDLDDALTDRLGSVRSAALQAGIQSLHAQRLILGVECVRYTVREQQNAIPWLQLNTARAISGL